MLHPNRLHRILKIFVIGLFAVGANGCANGDSDAQFASRPEVVQINQLLNEQRGGEFRNKPYLEMAAMLQALPRDLAVNQLRVWAHSGKHEGAVIIFCRMLFVAGDGGPLKRAPSREVFDEIDWLHGYKSSSPFQDMYALGATHGSDWPDWPLTFVNGAPFLIAAEYSGPISGPYPFKKPLPLAPVYLEYCLREGQWTPHRYAPVDLSVRQQALAALLQSSTWKRPLLGLETEFLTGQITDAPMQKAPPLPPYIGLR